MDAIISKKEPYKSLLVHLGKAGGRNNQGRITIRHRGGGQRKLYRLVDFGQHSLGKKGTVLSIEYDPNRNAFIALIQYADNTKGYILAPHNVAVGNEIICDEKTEVQIGNRMRMQNIPIGTQIYCLELEEGRGGKLVRGAGGVALVLAQEGGYTHVQLPSSEVRKISDKCFASIGMVSNPEHRYKIIGKAGSVRLKGRRPKVRGSAMNPADHPHGGGEGRQGIGMKYPKTPWGKHALGVKTRNKKKWTSKLILQRRKKKNK